MDREDFLGNFRSDSVFRLVRSVEIQRGCPKIGNHKEYQAGLLVSFSFFRNQPADTFVLLKGEIQKQE